SVYLHLPHWSAGRTIRTCPTRMLLFGSLFHSRSRSDVVFHCVAMLPIANAILTTENHAKAEARQVDKGRDAAQVAVEMANLLAGLA
ncbi:MAG TPA: 6,7-dimethyl-8-ribityllumazine synthase, partial [Ramlibacter sp.]